jgi:hypothetical protein
MPVWERNPNFEIEFTGETSIRSGIKRIVLPSSESYRNYSIRAFHM